MVLMVSSHCSIEITELTYPAIQLSGFESGARPAWGRFSAGCKEPAPGSVYLLRHRMYQFLGEGCLSLVLVCFAFGLTYARASDLTLGQHVRGVRGLPCRMCAVSPSGGLTPIQVFDSGMSRENLFSPKSEREERPDFSTKQAIQKVVPAAPILNDFVPDRDQTIAHGHGVASAPAFAFTNLELTALAGRLSSTALRCGIVFAGDVPCLLFRSSGSPCTIEGGDLGSQVPSADGRCWMAVHRDRIDARQFGALPNATDAAPYVQKAVMAACALGTQLSSGAEVFLGQGSFVWKTPISWSCGGVTLSGANHGGTVINIKGTYTDSLITIGTSGSSSTNPVRGGVRDIVFLNGGALSNGAIIEVDNGHEIVIDDFTIYGETGSACKYGVWLRGGSDQYGYHVTNFDIGGCNVSGSYADGGGGFSAGIEIGDAGTALAQEVFLGPGIFGPSATGLFHCIDIRHGSGIYSNGTVSCLGASDTGIVIYPYRAQFVKAVFFDGVVSDSNGGWGWILGQHDTGYIVSIHLTNAWGSSNSAGGMRVVGGNAGSSLIQNVSVTGEFSNNRQAGIVIGTHVTQSTLAVNLCNNSQSGAGLYPGLLIGGGDKIDYIKVIGSHSGDCLSQQLGHNYQSYGYVIDSEVDYLTFALNDSRNNLNGGLKNLSTGSHNNIAKPAGD